MQFTFTKQGPGRIHNNAATDRRFRRIKNIHNEMALRMKFGRVSDAFIKRWNKHFRYLTPGSESILSKLYGKFSKFLRK